MILYNAYCYINMPRTGKPLTYNECLNMCTDKEIMLIWTEDEWNANYKNRKTPVPVNCTQCNKIHHISMQSFTTKEDHGKLCDLCRKENSSQNQAKRQSGGNILINIKSENECIYHLINSILAEFESKKAYDKCKSDIICIQKGRSNNYMGIQVKSTSGLNKGGFYSFGLNGNTYNDLLLFCMCTSDGKMWLIPYNEIGKLTGINISTNESPKYDKYEVTTDNLCEKMLFYYHSDSIKHFPFSELNTPIDEYTRREQQFTIIRETYLSELITFEYPSHEGESVDFHIGSNKIQEKVGSKNEKSGKFMFHLGKNSSHPSYKKGDNDFYWLNYTEFGKHKFYLVPEEKILNKKGDNIISTITIITQPWLEECCFDYDAIDVSKLKKILKICN